MATTEVISEVLIDEKRCLGCGYCIHFCPRGCLVRDANKISRQGYNQAKLIKPELCTTCGICAQICPRWAIEVYLTVESPDGTSARERVFGAPKLSLTPSAEGCVGCQHSSVGRVVTDVLEEMGIGDKAIALDAISCGGSSAFGFDFGQVLGVYDQPTDIATIEKQAKPEHLVVAVTDIATFNRLGIDSMIGAMDRGEKITVICCNDTIHGHKGRQIEPAFTWSNTTGRRQFIIEEYPHHLAELAAAYKGVTYSARGALTALDDYQRTKEYIKSAFQKQMANAGFSFVEVLCACFSKYVFTELPIDCLQWIQEKMIGEFPLGELKNVDLLQ
jgi:2-oxoglutarate/2-oxoacid ferredoxin oxidoreductase subunit beta